MPRLFECVLQNTVSEVHRIHQINPLGSSSLWFPYLYSAYTRTLRKFWIQFTSIQWPIDFTPVISSPLFTVQKCYLRMSKWLRIQMNIASEKKQKGVWMHARWFRRGRLLSAHPYKFIQSPGECVLECNDFGFFTFLGITTHPWHPKGPRLSKFFGKKENAFFSIISKFKFRNSFFQIFTIFSAYFMYGVLNINTKSLSQKLESQGNV